MKSTLNVSLATPNKLRLFFFLTAVAAVAAASATATTAAIASLLRNIRMDFNSVAIAERVGWSSVPLGVLYNIALSVVNARIPSIILLSRLRVESFHQN